MFKNLYKILKKVSLRINCAKNKNAKSIEKKIENEAINRVERKCRQL